MTTTILIVEDHSDLAANIGDFLEAGGFTVDFAANGPLAVQLAANNHYDAVVLDIMLPGIDGYEVCHRMRNQLGLGMPIIMLTARDTLDDKLTGFGRGADDYLVKPFELKELEARIHALIRRQRGELENSTLRIGELTFDIQTMQVSRSGQNLKLSPTGLKILRLLMRESPKVVSREQIEMEIWGDDAPDSDALRSHLYTLRKVIDKPFDQQLLHTIPGVGFKLCDDSQ
ncbi:response regulator transcription factor [bacterium SCSIO 12696]|nr:response regulator transcription factor [bacterium SCSIO 12696]